MATTIDQQTGLARRDHRRAERLPRHRAAGPFANPVGNGDDAGGPFVAFLEAGRDDADDPGVPALGGGEHERRRLRPRLDTGDGLLQGARLYLAALAVVVVKAIGE